MFELDRFHTSPLLRDISEAVMIDMRPWDILLNRKAEGKGLSTQDCGRVREQTEDG